MCALPWITSSLVNSTKLTHGLIWSVGWSLTSETTDMCLPLKTINKYLQCQTYRQRADQPSLYWASESAIYRLCGNRHWLDLIQGTWSHTWFVINIHSWCLLQFEDRSGLFSVELSSDQTRATLYILGILKLLVWGFQSCQSQTDLWCIRLTDTEAKVCFISQLNYL